MKKFFFLSVVVCLLSLLNPSIFENIAVAQGYGPGGDSCSTLHTNGEPRAGSGFSDATFHISTDDYDYIDKCSIMTYEGTAYVMSSYQVTVNGTNDPVVTSNCCYEAYDLANNMGNSCGIYTGIGDDVPTYAIARYINTYMGVQDGSYPLPTTVNESHSGTGFGFTVAQWTTNASDNITWTWDASASSDGFSAPTVNFKNGKDKNTCPSEDCHGIPVWNVSQPYLNLWVNDTPVFYKTSLGETIPFQITYKQRDTRPKNDNMCPATGWSHNWYSYIHFCNPILATLDSNNSDTNLSYVSARGYAVRNNWLLSTNNSQWQAMLYSPGDYETYFNQGNTGDQSDNITVTSLTDTNGIITGFRVVRGDGSQDIYGLVVLGTAHTYGIVNEYGCQFDKPSVSGGMQGIWNPDINGSDTPHQTWQADDDPMSFVGSEADYSVVALRVNWGSNPPSSPIEYVSRDAVLTDRIDAYGNRIHLSYSLGLGILASITDYDNNVTTFGYNGYNLTSVNMPHGRSANFEYDSNGCLSKITDAMNMSSTFTYTNTDGGLNYRIRTMTTPYGTTTFDYEDDCPYASVRRPSYMKYDMGSGTIVDDTNTIPVFVGDAEVNHKITVTYPNASKSIYYFITNTNRSWVQPSITPGPMVGVDSSRLDTGGQGRASLLYRNCFVWSQRETPLLSQGGAFNGHDYRLGTWKHYPVDISSGDPYNATIGSSPTFIREASADGTNYGPISWFLYDNAASSWQISGEPLNYSQAVQSPNSDNALVTSFSFGGPQGVLSSVTQPYSQNDGTIGYRTYSFSYTTTPDGQFPYLLAINAPNGYSKTLISSPVEGTVGGYSVIQWPVISWQDSANNVSTTFYNSRHQPIGTTNSIGMVTTNFYCTDSNSDSYNFLYQAINLNDNATNTFCFHNGELAFFTTPLKLSGGFTHDALGRITSIQLMDLSPDTNLPSSNLYSYYTNEFATGSPEVSTNIYDRLDLAASSSFPSPTYWKYFNHDAMGQLISIVDYNSNTTSVHYCSCGGVDYIFDPLGNFTEYDYDITGRPVKTVGNNSFSKTISYDSLGRVVNFTNDSTGLSISNYLNAQGLPISISGSGGLTLGNVNYNYYDDTVNYSINSLGIGVTNTYDVLGRILTANSSSRTVGSVYSDLLKTSDTDANGKTTSYSYNLDGLLSATTNANNEVQFFNYGLVGNILSSSNNLNQTYWTYNHKGQKIYETNSSGIMVRSNFYNRVWILASAWSIQKGSTLFFYDPNNNLTRTLSSDGNTYFTYDALNRLISTSNSVGVITFAYTNFGAFNGTLSSEQGPWSNTVLVGYTNFALNSIALDSPSNWTEIFGYDTLSRITNIVSPAGSISFLYNGNENQISSILFPGSTITNTFDSYGELTTTTLKNSSNSVLNSYSYLYDLDGRKTNVSNSDGTSVAYTYDDIGQLTSAVTYDSNSIPIVNQSYGYSYDSVGNLTNNVIGGITNNASYNNLNQLLRTYPVTNIVNFITNINSFASTRNNYTGWVGYRITVRNSPITVASVGRMMLSGNSHYHTVKFINCGNQTDVSGGSATINMSGGSDGQFVYTNLSSPITLLANTAYYIMSSETSGGDTWYDWGNSMATTSVAVDDGVSYGSNPYYNTAMTNYGHIPVNFSYQVVSGNSPVSYTYDLDGNLTNNGTQTYVYDHSDRLSQVYVTNQWKSEYYYDGLSRLRTRKDYNVSSASNLPFVTNVNSFGNVRNDYTGWVGYRITVGNVPITVNSVGRMMLSGNSHYHTVKFINYNTGLDVSGGSATVNMTGRTPGQFVYTNLSSTITLSANTAYYIMSSETAGGDTWYNYNTSMTTTSLATDDGVSYGSGYPNWYNTPMSNYGHVPVNFTCGTTNSWNQTNEIRYIYFGNKVIQERNGQNQPTATYTIVPGMPGPLGRTDSN